MLSLNEDLGTGRLAAIALVYFLPSLIAVVRGHHHLPKIVLVNLFLGITVYFWVVAMVWATTTIPRWPEQKPGFRSRFVSVFLPFR